MADRSTSIDKTLARTPREVSRKVRQPDITVVIQRKITDGTKHTTQNDTTKTHLPVVL